MKIVTNENVAAKPVLRRLVALLVLSILVVGLAVLAVENFTKLSIDIPWLRIAEVKVSSEWPVTPEMVKGWMPPLEGKNILGIDARTIVNHLESKPWVKAVTLKKEYPDRVTFEVVTRRAEAIEIFKGQSHFVDDSGRRIEKTSANLLKALDLPVISFERDASASRWNLSQMVGVLEALRRGLASKQIVSQLLLGDFPYFRVFLSRPRLEVSFSFENWQSQLPILALLLHSPPAPVGHATKINLIFPKKAVVSSPLSQ